MNLTLCHIEIRKLWRFSPVPSPAVAIDRIDFQDMSSTESHRSATKKQ
jgi:hypothetical protein